MIPILMYHNIAAVSKDLYTVSLTNFESQIEWLQDAGYRSLDLQQIFQKDCQKVSFRDKLVIFTFDDGDIGSYTYAYPLLRKYGFNAIFFVTASLVGTPNKVKWEELRKVSRDDIIIGSHGLTHKALASLSKEQIREELMGSKKIIEEHIGCQVKFLSVPEGSYSRLVVQMAQEAGYKLMFTSNVGYNGFNADAFLLRRFVIRGDYTMLEFKRIIDKDNRFLMRKKVEQFAQSTFKNFLGTGNYKKLKKDLIGIKSEPKR